MCSSLTAPISDIWTLELRSHQVPSLKSSHPIIIPADCHPRHNTKFMNTTVLISIKWYYFKINKKLTITCRSLLKYITIPLHIHNNTINSPSISGISDGQQTSCKPPSSVGSRWSALVPLLEFSGDSFASRSDSLCSSSHSSWMWISTFEILLLVSASSSDIFNFWQNLYRIFYQLNLLLIKIFK